jgi:NIMA (never in mitosis gene a)-related kinase
MELADGGALSKFIGKELPESQILQIFFQIVYGLKAIHKKGILHRDLKAENIFFMKNGEVKIGDFGLSRYLKNGSPSMMSLVGTSSYMSPELLNQEPYGFPTDIWSLGVIIYQMATGEKPYQADTSDEMPAIISSHKPEPIKRPYSQSFKKLISLMLKKKPQKRITLEAILDSKLHAQYLKMGQNNFAKSVFVFSSKHLSPSTSSSVTSHNSSNSSLKSDKTTSSNTFFPSPPKEDSNQSDLFHHSSNIQTQSQNNELNSIEQKDENQSYQNSASTEDHLPSQSSSSPEGILSQHSSKQNSSFSSIESHNSSQHSSSQNAASQKTSNSSEKDDPSKPLSSSQYSSFECSSEESSSQFSNRVSIHSQNSYFSNLTTLKNISLYLKTNFFQPKNSTSND